LLRNDEQPFIQIGPKQPAVLQLAANGRGMHAALRRDLSNVMRSSLPLFHELDRLWFVDDQGIWNRVEQWLQMLAKFLLGLEELSPRAI
jgi:hypothetical protein